MLYSGIDLRKRTLAIHTPDAAGAVVRKADLRPKDARSRRISPRSFANRQAPLPGEADIGDAAACGVAGPPQRHLVASIDNSLGSAKGSTLREPAPKALHQPVHGPHDYRVSPPPPLKTQ